MTRQSAPVGSFISTTNIWDPSIIYSSDDLSPDLKEILVRMYQNLNLMAIAINTKDTGYYVTSEFVNGQLYFPNPINNSGTNITANFRQVWRKIINFGPLPMPNAGPKAVAHNIPINSGFTFTRIYATASDTTGLLYIPIPYTSNAGATDMVEIDVNATDVVINTGTVNRSNYNVCYVVLEFIKS
jgi:hypothetical protein